MGWLGVRWGGRHSKGTSCEKYMGACIAMRKQTTRLEYAIKPSHIAHENE